VHDRAIVDVLLKQEVIYTIYRTVSFPVTLNDL